MIKYVSGPRYPEMVRIQQLTTQTKIPSLPKAYVLPKGIQCMVTYMRHRAWSMLIKV